MAFVEEVQILGFWGDRTITIPLRDDVNFLIGPNGSGKTTIINTLAAVLNGDIRTLFNSPFSIVTVKLRDTSSTRKPIISVKRQQNKSTGVIELEYGIKNSTRGKTRKYIVEGPHEDRIYYDPDDDDYPFHKMGADLSTILEEFVEVNWLSIQRSQHYPRRRRLPGSGSSTPVDHKLTEVSRGFSNYFSLLSNQAGEETKGFQEQVFLSLLQTEEKSESFFSQINLDPVSRESILDVLLDLGVSRKKANGAISTHRERLNTARKIWEQERSLSIDDARVISDSLRVKDVVNKWTEMQGRLEAIFKPRTEFISIMNRLLEGKTIEFDARSQPLIVTKNARRLPVSVLSSGEKQLYILLGEALLQEDRPVVFISDEPELSLHVRWQRSLFENVRRLNPNCQIISATHSPDIVGKFQQNTLNIMDYIK